MTIKFAAAERDAVPVYLTDTHSLQDVLQALPKHVQTWAEVQQFKGLLAHLCSAPMRRASQSLRCSA